MRLSWATIDICVVLRPSRDWYPSKWEGYGDCIAWGGGGGVLFLVVVVVLTQALALSAKKKKKEALKEEQN